MAPSGQTNYNIVGNDSQTMVAHPQNTLVKFCGSLLARSHIQTGMKQLARISQPIITRIDNKVVRLTGNLSRWVSHKNIYNQLTNVWLSLNLPFSNAVVPYDVFLRVLGVSSKDLKRPEIQSKITTYYNYISTGWGSLYNPTNNEIKYNILESVANAINRTYHLEDDTLAKALFQMLKMLMEKRKELVSSTAYLKLVKVSLGEKFNLYHSQTIQAASNEYYTFAKRFLLIDFPLATNSKNILGLIVNFAQETGFYYSDSTLSFVERRLDGLLRFVGRRPDESYDDASMGEKMQRIMKKGYILSGYPLAKFQEAFRILQKTRTYATFDNVFHMNDALYLTQWGYNRIKETIVEPGFTSIKIFTNKTKDQVTVVMHGLDVDMLKAKYRVLHAKYEILQKCVVMVADETVKLVFDKKALNELGENGKKEMIRLYQDIKSMEKNRIRDIGVEYYAKLLKKVRSTYNTASRAIYYKKKEVGDEVAANAVKPENDLGAEAYDRVKTAKNIV